MKLCVIGSGYVGLVSGACFADVGNLVCCVDNNPKKIELLNSGEVPIFEPGLSDIIKACEKVGRLSFTTNLAEGLMGADICFITVDTPPDGDGRADLRNVLAVAESIGKNLTHKTIVVTKSTVPVGTTFTVKEVIAKELTLRGLDPEKILAVASNPEFLKEGDAVGDFMKPDRVVVGVEDKKTGEILHELYRPFMRRADRFIQVSIPSAELIKYAANSMLAVRISFMNEMARLCDKVGADVDDIRRALGMDPRVGPDFLYAGLGYGGSCLPKDTKAVIELGKDCDSRLLIVEAVDRANELQRQWFWEKFSVSIGGEGALRDMRIALWGLAFKANTDDVRFAPSIYIIEKLITAGARVSAFDPVAVDNAKAVLGELSEKVKWARDAYSCAEGAHSLIICTEWREFRSPDFLRLKSIMSGDAIFDGRNLYDPAKVRDAGFNYFCVGKNGHK